MPDWGDDPVGEREESQAPALKSFLLNEYSHCRVATFSILEEDTQEAK